MNIVIVSAFRNASWYIKRYCEQMDKLQERFSQQNHTLQLVLGYGDSHDGTGEILFEETSHRFPTTLVDVSHGGLHYGSIVHPKRFKQLAFVGNKLWEAIPEDADVVGLVESDLIWQPYVISSLAVTVGPNAIYAPMIYHEDGRFYDTWAFRCNGINFKNERPFHPDLGRANSLRMDSVGSVLFMQRRLAKQLHWPEEDVVVGLCNQARSFGADIWLWTSLAVYHK